MVIVNVMRLVYMNIFKRAGIVVRDKKEQLKAFSDLVKTHKNMVEAKSLIAKAVEKDNGASPLLEQQEKRIETNEAIVREEAKKVSNSIPDKDYKALRTAADLPSYALLSLVGAGLFAQVGALFIGYLAKVNGFIENANYDVKQSAKMGLAALGMLVVYFIARAIRNKTAAGKAAASAEKAKDIASGKPIVEEAEEQGN